MTCCPLASLCAQTTDSLNAVRLREVSVAGSTVPRSALSAQPSVYVSPIEMKQRSGHSLMDLLSQTEGVQAMDIGVGFSKPMIRGLGFQRIAVAENGVKQEGQQWGADHGLEIDAYHVEGVRVVKGPSSVLYGSDAMGGAIEILPPAVPQRDTIAGEALLSFESVCSGLNASVMLQMKRGSFYSRVRYTERHWADYKVPADSFTYLSMRLPIHDRQLKNTAGMERSLNAMIAYRHRHYEGRLSLSDSYQRTGFFSGAHGLPTSASLDDDRHRWNIDLPYSMVNHLKLTTTNTWTASQFQTRLTIGYQQNHREEWSRFHTHNPSQQPPSVDPDKELLFRLHTGSGQLQVRYTPSTTWECYAGLSATLQHNGIAGYGFLIPAYNRQEGGAYLLTNYQPSPRLKLSGSVRYDIGHIHAHPHGNEVGELNRRFNDYSLTLGMEYEPRSGHTLRASLGRAFRLPSVNELTSNGVHHGAFRHEQGDAHLVSEQGWQADLSYTLSRGRCEVTLSPFGSYYPHFITLHPTGQWSPLPDAGQVYRYEDSPTLLCGGELHLKARLWRRLHYTLSGEYVYTLDSDTHTATPFTPPATVHNTLSWEAPHWRCFVECQSVAAQNRVCHNELKTPGCNLVHLGGSLDFHLRQTRMSLLLHVRNLLNTPWLNHLNFYRRIELPEAGTDVQTTIRLNF